MYKHIPTFKKFVLIQKNKMPRKRKQSRWAKKRSTAAQPRAPIADSQVVKMRYGELVSLTPTGGTSASYLFRCNGVFDPNYTGSGHQPYGFDQWANFYDHVTVIGSRIRATFMPGNTAANIGQSIASITVEDDTATTTTINSLIERTGAVWKFVPAAGGPATTLTKKFSTKKFFNVSDVKDNSALKGTFTSDPSDQAYFHLNVTSSDGSTTPSTINIVVDIEYIVLLSERKNLLES